MIILMEIRIKFIQQSQKQINENEKQNKHQIPVPHIMQSSKQPKSKAVFIDMNFHQNRANFSKQSLHKKEIKIFYRLYNTKMTDIIDSVYSKWIRKGNKDDSEQIYLQHEFQLQAKSCQPTNLRDNSFYGGRQIEIYSQVVPFYHYQFWNYRLLLVIRHMNHQICTQIKILSPKGDILKVMSQYHRTFLYRKFLQKHIPIIPKVHPETGQISLSKAFSYSKIHCKDNYQMVVENLFSSVSQNQDQIAEIINLIQNKDQDIPLIEPEENKTNIPMFIRLCAKNSNKQNSPPQTDTSDDSSASNRQNTHRRSTKSRTYGGGCFLQRKKSKVQQMSRYLNNPLGTMDQIWQSKNINTEKFTFKRQVQNILGSVQKSLVRKDSVLKNFEVLKLPQEKVQSLCGDICMMKQRRMSRDIRKIDKNGTGGVNVQIHIRRYSAVQKTYKFLSSLPGQFELSFINNYFFSHELVNTEQGKQVILELAIRRQELLSYLESNSRCISFSTKLRILSQLISSTYLLEKKCSTLMINLELNNFSIAKNMMLKLNDLHYLQHLTPQQQTEFQEQIRLNLIQNQINISKIYSKIFYQKDLLKFKSNGRHSKKRHSYIEKDTQFQEKEIVIDKIYEECGYYGPKKLMTLLTCIFIPYIPMVPFQQIKKDPPCKNLKWGIASLIKILQNMQ